jgi:hypothetical protein
VGVARERIGGRRPGMEYGGKARDGIGGRCQGWNR